MFASPWKVRSNWDRPCTPLSAYDYSSVSRIELLARRSGINHRTNTVGVSDQDPVTHHRR
jgi:hypothetical protein